MRKLGTSESLAVQLAKPLRYFPKQELDKLLKRIKEVGVESLLNEATRLRTHFFLLQNLDSDPLFKSLAGEYDETLNRWLDLRKYFHDKVFDLLKRYEKKVFCLKDFNIFSWTSSNYSKSRFSADFDFMPEEGLVEEMRSFFSDEGYVNGYVEYESLEFSHLDRDRKAEDLHYELMPLFQLIPIDETPLSGFDFSKLKRFRFPICRYREELYTYIKIDIHADVAQDLDANFVWSTFATKLKRLPHSNLFGFEPEDLIWYLSLKLYYESHNSNRFHHKKNFRYLIDIFLVIKSCDIQWGFLLSKIITLKISPALYYTFEALDEIFNFRPNPSFMKSLKEEALKPELRNLDLGCFMRKLFCLGLDDRLKLF
ncbi:MAG: nucleotidyltransferase family protein [Bacteriovoracaceae bacterium]